LNQILHTQAQFNVDMMKRDQRRKIEMQLQMQNFDRSRAEWNVLYYEVLHNLVLETTRNGIELKNLRMRVEALASRLDFSERRVRALEGVVQYRPEALRGLERQRAAAMDGDENTDGTAENGGTIGAVTPSEGRRRRRRRRGRRAPGLTNETQGGDDTAPDGDENSVDAASAANGDQGGDDDRDGQ
jgi:hypothetical protein